MKPLGRIRGFASYTPAQMERMRADLSLSLSPRALQYFASYYGKSARRDPAIDELLMLDGLLGQLSATPDAWGIGEILTEDAFVAETYADLYRKRCELMPQATYPCTLREAPDLINRYLERVGKSRTHAALSIIGESGRPQLGSIGAEHCVSAAGIDAHVRLYPRNTLPPEREDLLATVLPTPAQSPDDVTAGMEWLMAQPRFRNAIKHLTHVSEAGLLATLLELADGIYLDMRKLSRSGDPVPLPMLNHAFGGLPLFRIAHRDYEALYLLAKECGIRFTAIAAISKDAKFTFKLENGEIIELDTALLRSLHLVKACTAKLTRESPASRMDVLLKPLSARRCPYLSTLGKADAVEAEVADTPAAVSAASVRADASPFLQALYATLAPVTALAAAGCPTETQRLSVRLILPSAQQTPKAAGASLAAILGLYRAQSELAIPAAALETTLSDRVTAPQLAVFSTDRGRVTPSTLRAEGNAIVSFEIPILPDGMPDFAALRTLLARVSEAAARGVIQSARVVLDRALTDLLREMQTATLACHLDDPRVAAEGACRLAILAEVSAPIEGARPIGHVVKNMTKAFSENLAPTLPDAAPLTLCGAPCVALLADSDDSAAAILCRLFIKEGVKATLLTPSTDPAVLARTILTAQTLLLCGKASLPEDTRVAFALDTLRRAGGSVLGLGTTDLPRPAGTISLPEGIPEEIWRQICSKM